MEVYKIDTPEVVTDEQIDALMSDWFDRDGETYVRKRKTGRLGWEKELVAGSSYSEWMLSAPTEKELITRAYSLGRDTIIAMDLPRKVNVRISKNTSCTDGSVVFLATEVFDDTSLGTAEKLDVFLGYAVHEGCHVLWTDFTARIPGETKLRHTIANILEDERIEVLCGEHKPGFANFLEKVKSYCFDVYYKKFGEEGVERGTLIQKFLDMFLKIIRYPKYLDRELITKFYKYLVEIKEVLTPYPTSTMEVQRASVKIEEIIRKFYADEMTEEEKRSSEDSSEEGDDADTGSEGDAGGKESEGEGEDSDSSEKGESSKRKHRVYRPGDKEVSSKIEEDVEDSSFEESIAPFVPDEDGDDDVSSVIKRDSEFAEVVEGSITLGTNRDVIFTNADGNPTFDSRYKDSYERIRRYIPAISKVLKAHALEFKYVLHGMRSGKLDTAKLAEAFQGVPTVYVREGEVKTDKISVCLLVDESGSMGGIRERAARDTAILINEAIGSVSNVDLFIYGHTGDIRRSGTTEITVYKEHGFDSRKALGGVSAKCENRDGVAIYETARRVRKQTSQQVLMFVISDGTPAASSYHGSSAIAHTKSMVTKTEGMGFTVVQICINPCYDPGLMFKHYVKLTDMGTLSIELNKVIKKALLKATKKTFSGGV